MIYEVFEKIERTYSGKDLELLKKAYDFAKKAHEGQKRASGEEYFSHPCAVADILVDLGLDASTVSAAFLHDVIEDTPYSETDIKNVFGDEILELVQGVTKLAKIEFTSFEEEQAENFRKIFVAMAKDIRVIIIKLADRLHNMRSLNFLSKERQYNMAKETLDIFAPLACRLGISELNCEMEDLCLKYLEPDVYETLSLAVEERTKADKDIVDSVVFEVKEIVNASGIKGAEIFGRKKHLYSIYKKMKRQNKTIDQIYDIVAVRVLVNTVDECYEILGKIHNKWKPVPGRIKDYIATPKPNMYSSLHTTVVTNYGKPFEIQIRTYEMNHTAEYGIAAHWKYKENKKETDNFDDRLSWIREVMEWQGGLKDSKEFLNTIKGDVYSSEVLVFTPNGEVKSLPKEATPLDYAYSIHSEIGNKCVGCKVNGKIVPLNYTLKVGDVVEILTSDKSKGPSWDWLKIVKSSGSRLKIKQFFRREMKEENGKVGKSMLEEEAKRKGFILSEILTDDAFNTISSRFHFTNKDEMFSAIGFGAVSSNQVLLKLIDFYRKTTAESTINKRIALKDHVEGSISVKGAKGLAVRFAKCCNPVPGDDIVGFISRGRGVVVHRTDCPNLTDAERERLVEVSWNDKVNNVFNAEINVSGDNQAVILSVVANALGKLGMGIISTNGRIDNKTKKAIVSFNIQIRSIEELNKLIDKIKREPNIIDVYRTAY
ncbi:MAG: bifunctional (p)ppGpp synthetase/guanosine-3',5'-bis(diphosphate) 3'-pyrophosphohydrolase [Clostridia bacterium]|nr:bifunctional (p)ppGpp synthetase/guanosine-3',5'-bis(diphosphate) 3'-pyrophosphohydrolase [Clostridia bacterium]